MLICNKTFLQFLTDLGVATPLKVPWVNNNGGWQRGEGGDNKDTCGIE